MTVSLDNLFKDESINEVVALERDGRQFYFVALEDETPESSQEAEQLIARIDPDTVCLSMCETRYRSFTEDQFWRKLSVVEAIKQKKGILLLANVGAASFQHRFGLPLRWPAGSEMIGHISHAERIGADWIFAERDILISLRRAWKTIPGKRRFRLIWRLIRSIFHKPLPDFFEEPEKRRPNPLMRDALVRKAPEAETVLVDECDKYLAGKIRSAAGEKVVAIATRDRMPNVLRYFDSPVDLEELDSLPEPKPLGKLLTWIFPIAILVMLITGIFFTDKITTGDLLLAWVLPNMLCAGLFALVGRPKALTMAAVMCVSPISLMVPPLRTGIVAGVVEGWLRRPVVSDCERIPLDIRSFRGIYRNRFTRVLFIAWLAHTGSSLGNYVGAALLGGLFT
jgi:pheromone shutdown-related protein TraB